VSSEALGILYQYGLAGVGLIVLGIVVVFLYRDGKDKDKAYNDLQEKRLAEAKEVTDFVIKPLEEQGKMSEKMYDILVSIKENDRRR
jgi:hypothetical protein